MSENQTLQEWEKTIESDEDLAQRKKDFINFIKVLFKKEDIIEFRLLHKESRNITDANSKINQELRKNPDCGFKKQYHYKGEKIEQNIWQVAAEAVKMSETEYKRHIKWLDYNLETKRRSLATERGCLFSALDQYNTHGMNVYCGVCPRIDYAGTKADHVEYCRCVFADLDSEKALKKYNECQDEFPIPTMVVDSGNGKWLYWMFTEPFKKITKAEAIAEAKAQGKSKPERDDWRTLLQTIIRYFGSDPAVHDAARIGRMPGFFNIKNVKNSDEVNVCKSSIIKINKEAKYEMDFLVDTFNKIAPELEVVEKNPVVAGAKTATTTTTTTNPANYSDFSRLSEDYLAWGNCEKYGCWTYGDEIPDGHKYRTFLSIASGCRFSGMDVEQTIKVLKEASTFAKESDGSVYGIDDAEARDFATKYNDYTENDVTLCSGQESQNEEKSEEKIKREAFNQFVEDHRWFPVESMPQTLIPAIKKYCKGKYQHPDYICGAIISASAMCLGKTYKLNCRQNGYIVSNQFSLILVGVSNASKSDPAETALSYLNQVQEERYVEYKENLRYWKEEEKRIEQENRNSRANTPVREPNEPKPVFYNQIITSSYTQAGFIKAHRVTPKGFNIYCDEHHFLMGGMNKFDAGSDDIAFMMALLDGGDYTQNRAGAKDDDDDGRIIVSGLYANMLSTSQPSAIYQDLNPLILCGFAARNWMIYVPKKRRIFDKGNDRPIRDLDCFFQRLLAVDMLPPEVDGGKPRSRILDFKDPDATRYGACWQYFEDMDLTFGKHPHRAVDTFIGKILKLFPKLICNLHAMKAHEVDSQEDPLLVSDETVSQAFEIAKCAIAQHHLLWTDIEAENNINKEIKEMIPYEKEYNGVCRYCKTHREPMGFRLMLQNIFRGKGKHIRDDAIENGSILS